MDTLKPNNSYHDGFWHFIEDNLPNYNTRDDVLCDDILLRYIEDDDVSKGDLEWIMSEFNGDKELVKQELIKLESNFAQEALKAYYEKQL